MTTSTTAKKDKVAKVETPAPVVQETPKTEAAADVAFAPMDASASGVFKTISGITVKRH